MNAQERLDRIFVSVLIAHYSPQNKCFVKEGEVLYAPPPARGLGARHGASHEFFSAVDHKTRCKLGWVKREGTKFSIGEFLGKYSLEPSPEQVDVLFEMFAAISTLPEGTPVGGSYFSRGVEHRHTVLSFHKVFLAKFRVGG